MGVARGWIWNTEEVNCRRGPALSAVNWKISLHISLIFPQINTVNTFVTAYECLKNMTICNIKVEFKYINFGLEVAYSLSVIEDESRPQQNCVFLGPLPQFLQSCISLTANKSIYRQLALNIR